MQSTVHLSGDDVTFESRRRYFVPLSRNREVWVRHAVASIDCSRSSSCCLFGHFSGMGSSGDPPEFGFTRCVSMF
jgi:hypothetical protein